MLPDVGEAARNEDEMTLDLRNSNLMYFTGGGVKEDVLNVS